MLINILIRIAPRDTMDAQNELIHHAKGASNIITDNSQNFNPDILSFRSVYMCLI